MSDSRPSRAAAPRAPVLTTGILARIHELNRDYLEVLLAERRSASGCTRLDRLPATQLSKLAALPPEARDMLAACPYALYSLGFENRAFWEALSAGWDGGAPDSRYEISCADPLPSPFCAVALFLAWHVAISNRLAAGMLYGMPESVARVLAGRPLRWLRRVAADYPDLLAPRWPANRCFWPNLIRCAAQGDLRKLETTHLLGIQLIAAELTGAATYAHRARRSMLLGARSPR